jgi:hypothetical protein|tara:strand:- start:706 stop:927 length:222 start_codon:yes stop_codon:yes gene_type:complete
MVIISELPKQNRFVAGFGRAVTGLVNFMLSISTARSRVRQIEALCAKTDKELAARGLTRQDIVRHVYTDVYYL